MNLPAPSKEKLKVEYYELETQRRGAIKILHRISIGVVSFICLVLFLISFGNQQFLNFQSLVFISLFVGIPFLIVFREIRKFFLKKLTLGYAQISFQFFYSGLQYLADERPQNSYRVKGLKLKFRNNKNSDGLYSLKENHFAIGEIDSYAISFRYTIVVKDSSFDRETTRGILIGINHIPSFVTLEWLNQNQSLNAFCTEINNYWECSQPPYWTDSETPSHIYFFIPTEKELLTLEMSHSFYDSKQQEALQKKFHYSLDIVKLLAAEIESHLKNG